MLESGSSGSVRGVLSNEHPYREPGPIAAVHRTIAERRDLTDAVEKLAEDRVLICAMDDDGRLVNGLGAVNLV